MERFGRKEPDAGTLAVIAHRLQRPHPASTSVEDKPIQENTVLKRANSDAGLHVILPHQRRDRNLENLKALSPNGERWLMQEYVETLITVGEWRVFVVNGHPIHTAHTFKTESGWRAEPATSFWSLRDIEYVERIYHSVSYILTHCIGGGYRLASHL